MIPFVKNDGGRSEAGFRGTTGDCVTRAIAIASGRPYKEVYERIRSEGSKERKGSQRKSTARLGVFTKRKWFIRYMEELGFKWVPTMSVGSGCKVHLVADELPKGRIVVSLSRHYAAVIDGVLHDSYHSGEARIREDGSKYARAVYGYWELTQTGR